MNVLFYSPTQLITREHQILFSLYFLIFSMYIYIYIYIYGLERFLKDR